MHQTSFTQHKHSYMQAVMRKRTPLHYCVASSDFCLAKVDHVSANGFHKTLRYRPVGVSLNPLKHVKEIMFSINFCHIVLIHAIKMANIARLKWPIIIPLIMWIFRRVVFSRDNGAVIARVHYWLHWRQSLH